MLSRVVAIVSGGASGLGAATVQSLLKHGARVVVADLEHQQQGWLEKQKQQQQQQQQQQQHMDQWTFATVDVTDPQQISSALDQAEHVFGEPVQVAVNCAGIALAKKTLSIDRETGLFSPHSVEIFRQTIEVNTIGSFNMARLAAQRMATRTPDDKDGLRGCIIHTASVAAYEGQIGQVAYSASKGGVVGMTLPMARDLSSLGIRVMTIVSINQMRVIIPCRNQTVFNETSFCPLPVPFCICGSLALRRFFLCYLFSLFLACSFSSPSLSVVLFLDRLLDYLQHLYWKNYLPRFKKNWGNRYHVPNDWVAPKNSVNW